MSQKRLLHKMSKALSGADFYLAGGTVLAEKPINSIDALLLKECKLIRALRISIRCYDSNQLYTEGETVLQCFFLYLFLILFRKGIKCY